MSKYTVLYARPPISVVVAAAAVETKQAKAPKAKTTEASTPPPTKEEASNPNQVIEKLKELAQLKEQGIISEKEFEDMKKKLIKDF